MKVIICGAGISGLSAGAFLARNGWQVVIVDHAMGPRPQGYMIDFFGRGWEAAEKLGIIPRIRELGYQIPRVDYVDSRGRSRASLPFARFSKVVSGDFTSILRPDLECAIREALPPDVVVRYGRTITAVGQGDDGVTATLDDGSLLEGELLVGADGIHSTVRSLLFGPEKDFFCFLGFHVAAYYVDDAHLGALVGDRVAVTDTRNESMFFYRLRDGRTAVLAVHRTDDPARPPDPQSLLQSRYCALGWICPEALAECPEDFYYDQVAQIRMPCWHSGRVVLLGDAAAAVSLLAGQGASLGMAGAYLLADHLRLEPDIGRALSAFETGWRSEVEDHQRAGADAAGWFVPATRRASIMRRMAIRLMRVPGVGGLIGSNLIGKSGAAL
ncbi:FAD-dependent monooxygenase [Arthrobacter oryzae]|uniref:FAD-dependent oxidoreductase n=1 Tax=Arthrobacter oryzae TaxID=409290 RepID=A0A3N0BSI4_9MICC|nr:FAD-dependent monooxygenase [Arthrobacter oryzae]RNL52059.1 FAD-dependent oxidoreductase [Arthrobacter oryzae]